MISFYDILSHPSFSANALSKQVDLTKVFSDIIKILTGSSEDFAPASNIYKKANNLSWKNHSLEFPPLPPGQPLLRGPGELREDPPGRAEEDGVVQ